MENNKGFINIFILIGIIIVIIVAGFGGYLAIKNNRAPSVNIQSGGNPSMIDLDAQPFLPPGISGIEEHQKGGNVTIEKRLDGELYIGGHKVILYLSQIKEIQEHINGFSGNEFRNEIIGKPVLNANVLDYLLVHPELIPKSWQKSCVSFFGTIYRSSDDGSLYVRCMYPVASGGWNSALHQLIQKWDSSSPVALLAN